jgi:hypothetical protein
VRSPVPGQKFMEFGDQMVVNPREYISKVGFRIEAGEFGRLDDCHRIGDNRSDTPKNLTNIGAQTGKDLAKTIQGKLIVEL